MRIGDDGVVGSEMEGSLVLRRPSVRREESWKGGGHGLYRGALFPPSDHFVCSLFLFLFLFHFHQSHHRLPSPNIQLMIQSQPLQLIFPTNWLFINQL